MIKSQIKLLSLSLLLLLLFGFKPSAAQAQWPPFRSEITFSHQEKLISYQLLFRQQAGIHLNDFTVKIPLPPGTRFVKAEVPPDSSADFNGEEVSFLTLALRSWQISFTVEIIDPSQTVFETFAWVSWVGETPGSYTIEGIKADTTLKPLSWKRPSWSRLQLEAIATSQGETITYSLYPKNVNSLRMWDLRVNLPIPAGATFVSIEHPPEFSGGFDGQSAVFTIIEMPRQTDFDPLKVTVSVSMTLTTPVVAQPQAFWKNVGRRVGLTIPAEETTLSGPVIVQPGSSQIVVADPVGDAAFPFYDLSAIAIEQEEAATKIVFYTTDPVATIDQSLRYQLQIDQDCSNQSGQPQGQERGWDYQLIYRHPQLRAFLQTWSAEQQRFMGQDRLEATMLSEGSGVVVRIPAGYLSDPTQFCWRAISSYTTEIYYPRPPQDIVPDLARDFWLTHYQITKPLTNTTDTGNPTTP